MIRYIQFELDEFRHLGDYRVYNRDELFGNKIGSRLNSYDHIIYPAIDLKLIIKSLHRIKVLDMSSLTKQIWMNLTI